MADRRRALGIAAALLGLSLTLTACGGSDGPDIPGGIRTPDNGGYHGTYLGDAPFKVVDQSLTDTDGEPFSVATDETPLKIVFFGYTNCPDICQAVMSTITLALTKLDEADRTKVEVVFVTTDPERDTEQALASYLARFADGYVGLTGPLTDIVRLGDSFKVAIEDGRKLPSGGYEIDHSTYTYGVVGDEARVIWSQTTSQADMAADMIKLLKS